MFRKIMTTTLAIALTGGALAWAQTAVFTDVPDDHPRKADIDIAVSRGWFTGYDDETFGPDRPVTDQQIARVVKRALGSNKTRAEFATFMRGGYDALNQVDPSDVTTTQAVTTTSQPTTTTQPRSPQYKLVGTEWLVRASNLREAGWSNSLFTTPASDKVPLLVSVTIEYLGDGAKSPLWNLVFDLYADGVEADLNSVSCDPAESYFGWSGKLRTLGSKTVDICFVADRGAQQFQLDVSTSGDTPQSFFWRVRS